MSNTEDSISEQLLGGSVTLTTIPGHTESLLTVRGKDHDLSPEDLKRLANMCVAAANLLEKPRDTSALEISIVDDVLSIQIGVATLTRALEDVYPTKAPSVFAESLARALREEEEDGTTLVHRMFDTAAEWCVEQGLDGVLDDEDLCPNCLGILYEVADCDDHGDQVGASMRCDSCLYSKQLFSTGPYDNGY
jgi:hypothetical protein